MKNETFFEKAYQVVKKIPQGRVTSYGAIASHIGAPGAARMVGWAMNQSHTLDEYIPAHRVVNRNGLLTGKHHFGGENTMKELLISEGIRFEGDQIIDFEKVFWKPEQGL